MQKASDANSTLKEPMITGRTGSTAPAPSTHVRCARCGAPLAMTAAYDDVDVDRDGRENEILVHWGCATLERQRQIVHDFYGRDARPAAGVDPAWKLWDVLRSEEREIVLAMLKRDELEVRERIATVLRSSLDAEGRAEWDDREWRRTSELRAKALRAVGLPEERPS
jgi:hypothetical protein